MAQDRPAAWPTVPRLPAVLVDRPRLADRLGPDRGAAWSLVVGPAGSGKTTLIRSWAAGRREPLAWISIDRSQGGPWRLVDLMVHALQQTRPEDLFDELDLLDMGDSESLMPLLVDDLGAAPPGARTILVLDDAHLLEAPEWDELGWFLTHLPASLHVIVSSRVDPPMALGRERASGHMTEVRSRDLAFDLEETQELVDAALGPSSPTAVAELQAQTQGWAAGLRLAVIACRDASDLEEVMTGFDGTHTTVAEYLLEEVLDRLSADARTILIECSVASVLGAPLAEALTGRDDAGDVLERLAVDGVFVTRTQAVEATYRFHPMLADLLRHELRRLDAASFRTLHRRAAEWCLGADQPVEAVEHLLDAQEYARAHELVMDVFADMYRGHRRQDLPRWLAALPDEVIAADLDRALRHCRALALLGQATARQWYRHCDPLVAEGDPRRAELQTLMALHHGIAGDLEQLQACWDDARNRRPPDTVDALDEVVATWEVRLETNLGDPDRAVELARALLATERMLVGDAPALSVLAGALDAADRPDEAVAVARSAIRRWRDDAEPELPAMIDALVLAAADSRRAGRLDEADELLAPARALTADHATANLLGALTELEWAAIEQARGRSDWRGHLLAYAEELRMANAPTPLVDRVEAATAASGGEPPGPSEVEVPGTPLAEPLTERELTILRAMASHLTFPEIGRELHISRHTVKSHAQHIYQKLGATSRSEAVAEARRMGLLGG